MNHPCVMCLFSSKNST